MKLKVFIGRIVYIGCCLFLAGIAALAYAQRISPAAIPASSVIRTVYLTFDDGPSANTDKILAALKKYGVNATFFVTGQYDEWLPKIADIDAAGHLVAPHSHSHNFSQIYRSSEAFWADQQDILNLIFTYTAKTPNIMRFAGGSSNTVYRSYADRSLMKRLVKECGERGIAYFDWNVDSRDWQNNRSASSIASNILKGVNSCTDNFCVVLMHDAPGAPHTAQALETVLPQLLEQGYVFDLLNNLSAPCHHGL